MSEFNMHVSVSHLTQVDRVQNDTHRFPMVHQQQNAQAVDNEMTQRMSMPVEPDAVEKKNIDPDKKKERNGGGKKKHRLSTHPPDKHPEVGGGSSFIDVTV